MKNILLLFVLVISLPISGQTIVEISVKGISDSKNEGAQKDREEAIVDAKRQACEKAGLALESKTTIKDFRLVSDYIETQSSAVLLPGFQVVDIGYVADGTYQVVLSGRIKTKDEDKISIKELRYAKALNEKGELRQCESILEGYIDSKDPAVSEEIKEDAYYFFIKWGYAYSIDDALTKFSAYYPQSSRISAIEDFARFAKKPIREYKKEFSVPFTAYQKKTATIEDAPFDKAIIALADTLIIVDYVNNEHTLLLDYTFYQSTIKNTKTPFAYSYKLDWIKGNLKKMGAAAAQAKKVELFSDARTYTPDDNPSYQASRSDIRFGNFKLSDYQLNGAVPNKNGTFPQKIVFTINQVSF